MRTFFNKVEYLFLVEATKIEITSFPFKTPLSEANVKTNRMATTKWIQSGHSLQNQGTFFSIFKIGQGRPPPFPPSCAPVFYGKFAPFSEPLKKS